MLRRIRRVTSLFPRGTPRPYCKVLLPKVVSIDYSGDVGYKLLGVGE